MGSHPKKPAGRVALIPFWHLLCVTCTLHKNPFVFIVLEAITLNENWFVTTLESLRRFCRLLPDVEILNSIKHLLPFMINNERYILLSSMCKLLCEIRRKPMIMT